MKNKNILNEQIKEIEKLITDNENLIANNENERSTFVKGIEKNKTIRNQNYDLFKEAFDFIVEKYEKEQYLDFSKYFISNLCEDIVLLEMNFENREESSVRGGCLPKINNKIICFEKKDLISDKLIDLIKIKNCSFQTSDLSDVEKNYLILKTRIKSGFYRNSRTTIINRKILNMIKNNQNCNLKDNFGLSSGHYKMMCHDKNIIESIQKEELDKKSFYGEKPEIYSILSKNKKAVEYLLSKGYNIFNSKTDNGMNPLLYSILTKSDNISKLLINNLSPSDLNQSTESKITPLHYAVKNNSLELSKLLVAKGALISNNNNTDGNTPFHLACDKGYNEIIDYFSNKCTTEIDRPDKQTVLHRAVKTSLISTKIIVKKYKKLKDSLDILLYSPKDIALLNGRLDCYYILNKDKERRFLLEKNSKLFSCMKKYNLKNKIVEKKDSNDLIDSLCEALKNNDKKNSNKIAVQIYNNNELKIKLRNTVLCKKLIKSAIFGKDIKYLDILSHLIDIKKNPISALVGKYGLITWIPELKKYGLDFFSKNKNKNIFDYAIENNNINFIECLLNTITEISEEELSSIVCKSLLNGNIDLIKMIFIKMEDKKFINIKITYEELGKNIKSNEQIFNFAKSLKPDSIKTIKIIDAIKYCQPNFVDTLLINNDLLKQEIDPINLIEIAEQNNRKDNIFIILKHFPNSLNTKINLKNEINIINNNLILFEKIIAKPSDGLTNSDIDFINKLLEMNSYKYLLTANKKKFIGHLIIENRMDILPKLIFSENFNIFLKDEYNNLPFHLQKFNENTVIDIILFLSKITHEKMISLFISIVYQSYSFLKKMNYLGFFINSIIDLLIKHPFFTIESFMIKNKDKKTLFNLIAESNEIIEVDKIKIMKLYENIKSKFSKEKIKKLINQQDIYGNTIVMYLLSNKHIFLAKKILEDFNELYDFTLYNISGNTILHCLFENSETIKLEETIIEEFLEVCSLITEKCPSLILSNNFNYLTPWLLAAGNGMQGVLAIMVKYYPIQIIEENSKFSSAIHEAAYNGKMSMIKYLIEYFNYSVDLESPCRSEQGFEFKKFPEKSTPLYAAAIRNSIESYKTLLELGANPFIKNIYGLDSISAFIRNGDERGLKYITNTISFNSKPSNDLYLFDLVRNGFSISFIKKYFKKNGFDSINITNDYSQNLLIIACIVNKPEIVYYLLENNINLLQKDKNDNNALHYCSKALSHSCNYIILEYLFKTKDNSKIKQILNLKNKNGNTLMHIAAKKNCLEIILNILVFISTYKLDLKMTRNNKGLTPLHNAINNKNWEISFLLKNYFQVSEELIKKVGDEYKNNIEEFLKMEDKGLSPKFAEKLKSFSKSDNFENIKKNENNMFKNYNYFNKKITCIKKDAYIKYSKYINNNKFLKILYKLNEERFNSIIKEFFRILDYSNIDEHEGIKTLIEFYIGFIFSNNDIAYFTQILDSLGRCINSLKSITPNHNIFFWLQSIIISYYESGNFPKVSSDLLATLEDFIKIMNNSKYLSLLPKPIFSYSCYQFVKNLISILANRKHEYNIIQIKYINMIPPLLSWEISQYNYYNIINYMTFSDNPLYEFVSKTLSEKDFPSQIIDYAIQGTLLLEKSIYIEYREKIKIMDIVKNKYLSKECNPEKILTTISILENLILNFGKKIFNENIIESMNNNELTIKDFEKVLLYLSQYKDVEKLKEGLSKLNNPDSFYKYSESIKSVDSGRSLNELIEAFNKVEFKLTDKEIEQLKEFGNYIQKREIYALNDLAIEGKKLGKIFRNYPTIKNLSKLLDIIRFGSKKIMKMEPYLIQLLSVAAFFLFFVNKPKDLKGRLGQIATGEGKSLIVAIIGLSLSLQGRFVDIITSTGYLAKRDQQKFKPLFDAFGISSSNITANNPSKEDYNGIILYGTNTDFEFSLLREELYMVDKMYTVPLDNNILEKRKFDSVIVDESDNLFLDTALNSARMAYPSKEGFNWIYNPMFEIVKKLKDKVTKELVRKELKTFCNGLYVKKIESVPDKKIDILIDSCQLAMKKIKGKDYIVKYDESSHKKKVFIVDLDTGRINIGSRWSYGVHEFVEVKENLIPETESLTIASISHPSYYDNYKCIFGLTGTIGQINERNEIRQIYHLDSFDVPTNFELKRQVLDKLIVENKEKKYEKIINEIKNYENRSILVILNTINETLEFSERLKKLGINHLLLNDIQNEKEEFILYYAGKPRSLVIATNAAGRGTDIILTKESLNNGGLHVIIGFFPENSRIEFQAIGRAGRQGQPGSAQIIFSKDEFNDNTVTNVDEAIKYRNNNILRTSLYRIHRTTKERFYYEKLKKYFELQKILFNKLNKKKNSLTFEKLKEDWGKFFTNDSEEVFDDFLSKYSWGFLLNDNSKEVEEILKEKIKILGS